MLHKAVMTGKELSVAGKNGDDREKEPNWDKENEEGRWKRKNLLR